MKLFYWGLLAAMLVFGESTVIKLRKACSRESHEPEPAPEPAPGPAPQPEPVADDCANPAEPAQPAKSMTDALTEMLTKVADPDNHHFDEFQKHFGKVIDILDPDTESSKVNSRVGKLTNDI